MNKKIDIGKSFSDGFNLYKNNFGIMLLGTLLATLIGSLTCGILYAPLLVGLFWVVDRLYTKDENIPTAGDIFKGMSKFGPAFICFILFIIIYSIACLVPVLGLIAAYIASPMMIFALMYIGFEDMEPIAAIKRVFQELFSGALLMPVLIGFLAGLAGGIGAIACGIGVIFTIPIVPAVYLCTYYQMKESNDDILDAEIVSTDDASTTAETQADSTPPKPPTVDTSNEDTE